MNPTDVSTDIAHAARQLLARPLLLALAVLPLAVAIATLAVLTAIVQATLTGPMPGIARDPGTLVELGRGENLDTLSWPDVQALETGTRSFTHVYAWRLLPVNARRPDTVGSTRALGMLVSGDYFGALGVRALHGRLLGAEDIAAGTSAPSAVISAAAFARLYDGDPARLVEPLIINGHAHRVLGVVDPGFTGHVVALAPDYWLPITLQPLVMREGGAELLGSHEARWVAAGGRLAAGIDTETARAELAAVSPRLPGAGPADETLQLAELRAVPAGFAGALGAFLGLLAALGVAVLLVACTNVAGWLLARSHARAPEFGMRMALGASRVRIVMLVLGEAAFVALLATALAVAAVPVLLSLLRTIALPAPFPVSLVVPFDAPGVLMTCALGVAALFAAGIVPALRVPASARMHAAGARATRSSRMRDGLVVGQVALTTLLLIGTGLLGHALHKARSVDVGFQVDGLVNADLDLGPRGYEPERAQQVAADVLAGLRARPGIEAAALARVLPLTMSSMSLGVVVDGAPPERALSPSVNVVSAGWFETLGIPVLGRGFADTDDAGREDVAVINRQLAQRLFGDGEAIGRSFRYGEVDAPRTLRVVGVAGEGRYASWHEDPEPFLYLPLAQWPVSELNVVARTTLPTADAGSALAAAMLAVDPDLPRPQVHAMTDTVALSLLPQRMAGLVSGVLGALGLLLAALGLYALVAQHVSARTREIGVRLSLGASPSRIAREVAGRGARLLGAGAVLGLLLAVGLARVAEGALFGVDAGDGLAFVAALAVLAAIGMAACLVPARRAAAIEPSVALRQD